MLLSLIAEVELCQVIKLFQRILLMDILENAKKFSVSKKKKRATEILPNVQTMRVIIICTRELPFKHNDPLRAIIILQPLPGNFVFFKETFHF